MKKVILFVSTDSSIYFNNEKALKENIDKLERDGKVYMVTLEEVEEI